MINKFYYIKGGSETYYFSLKKLLELNGHIVIDFSMKDNKNFDSAYEKYFINNIDYNKEQTIFKKIKHGINIIYSLEAKRNLEKLIRDTKPDIAHLHIFQHQLSPSILDVLKKYNIPIIYTAHDLKMICPNYKMYANGEICEECKGGKYYKCIKNSCVKNSKAKSMVNVIEAYFHKWKRSYELVQTIITPSQFYEQKFEEFGIEKNKIKYIPNFINDEIVTVNIDENQEKYFLYFGRLSEEKGIMTLVNAMKGVNFLLYIVGTGPCENDIKSYINNNNMTNIKMLGFKSGQELKDLVGNSKAVILPSEWYENGPYSAIEALQLGRPIIGADIGGIPELIEENGFIFEYGNVTDLKKKINMICSLSEEKYTELSNNSKKIFISRYTQNYHFKLLEDVYRSALKTYNSHNLNEFNSI